MLVVANTRTDEHIEGLHRYQLQSVSYLGTARTKEWAAAGVKENGPMELRGCKASNTYREGNAGLSGHPPVNLIHHLNMWNGADRQGRRVLCITVAQGGGCQGWGGGGGEVSVMDYFSGS